MSTLTNPVFWGDLFCAAWLPVTFAGWTLILLRFDAGGVSRRLAMALVLAWAVVMAGARFWLAS